MMRAAAGGVVGTVGGEAESACFQRTIGADCVLRLAVRQRKRLTSGCRIVVARSGRKESGFVVGGKSTKDRGSYLVRHSPPDTRQ